MFFMKCCKPQIKDTSPNRVFWKTWGVRFPFQLVRFTDRVPKVLDYTSKPCTSCCDPTQHLKDSIEWQQTPCYLWLPSMNSCLFKNNRYRHIIDFLNYSKSVTPSLVVILYTEIPQATLSGIKLTIAPKDMVAKGDDPFLLGPGPFFRGKMLSPPCTTDVHCYFQKNNNQKKHLENSCCDVNLPSTWVKPLKSSRPFRCLQNNGPGVLCFPSTPRWVTSSRWFFAPRNESDRWWKLKVLPRYLRSDGENDWILLDWILVFGSLVIVIQWVVFFTPSFFHPQFFE